MQMTRKLFSGTVENTVPFLCIVEKIAVYSAIC